MIGLSKEKFVEMMHFIKSEWAKQDQLITAFENMVPGNYCNTYVYLEYEEKFVELLALLMNDYNDDIAYFLYELPIGYPKRDDLGNELYYDEESLYNYLVRQDEQS